MKTSGSRVWVLLLAPSRCSHLPAGAGAMTVHTGHLQGLRSVFTLPALSCPK